MSDPFIGTSSQYKANFYRDMIDGDMSVRVPKDLGIQLDIDEDLYDIVGNSQKKARAFAQAANMLALSDDSGIFIPALNGEPGVAARRWGGELPDTVSDEEWIEYFFEKTNQLGDDERAVVKRQVITLARPDGELQTLDFSTNGHILRERADSDSHRYMPGGPFAALYTVDEFDKPEMYLDAAEKAIFTSRIRSGVLRAIKNLQ